MASHLKDPKGYYATLGVASTADQAAIKSAYRQRAKVLHPDHNKSPTAQADFQKLAEAYQVLSDEQKRRRYDAMGARLAAATNASAGANTGNTARANGGAEPPRAAQTPRQASPRSGASAYGQTASYGTRTRTATRSAARGPFEPPQACQCCGKVTAQPRYVVFPTVRGRIFKTVRSTIEGVFCKSCAEKTAFRTSLKNWLLGWWSLPFGPFYTVSALFTAARGGFFPRDRNFALLLKQARAFLMRNETALAHGLALQARGYAESPQEKGIADGLLKAAPAAQGKALRNKWLDGSWLRAMQLLPPLLISGLALHVLSQSTDFNLWGTRSQPSLTAQGPTGALSPNTLSPPAAQSSSLLAEGLDRPMLLRTGRLYEVTAPSLPLRTGPGTSYTTLVKLEAGSSVLVTENAPEGGWVRVLTSDGVSGFVAGRYLTPGLAIRGLDDSFRSQDGAPLTPPAATEKPPAPAASSPPLQITPPPQLRTPDKPPSVPAPPPTAAPQPQPIPAPQGVSPLRERPPAVPPSTSAHPAPTTSMPSALSPAPAPATSLSRPGAIAPEALQSSSEQEDELLLIPPSNAGSLGVFPPAAPAKR